MSPEHPGGQPRVGIAIRPATCIGPGGRHVWDHSDRCLGHPTSLTFWGGLGFVGLGVWEDLDFVKLIPGRGSVGERVSSNPPQPGNC
jgi:hypothetical protein